MRLWPQTTFGRLGLLIAAVALALMLLMSLALRSFGLGPSGAIYADLVVGNVLLAQGGPESELPANVVRSQVAPTRSHEALLPAQNLILHRARDAFGAQVQVRFVEGADSRVWVRSEQGGDWIGVRVPAFFAQSVGIGLWLLGFAALAVLLAAWWFARHLTRPLVRLAASTRTLAEGGEWSQADDPSAPREVRALQSALASASAELRQSVRERELLLAGVSHDLRTPLARLRLALELQGGLPDTERELMVGDVTEMDAIIGQFLDYVRDGRDESAESVNLSALLHDLVQAAAREGQDWQLQAPAECVAPVRALALRRALSNLMRNAQLHGAAPFRLELLVESDPAGRRVHIHVHDQGPGFPPYVLDNAGQAFVRSSPGRGGKAGSGLGLALVDRVARTHGGRLEVANSASGGGRASLVLPLPPL
jgi:two-component system, OmpR family, osmolarity sensor histidine kinase EnvZ